MIIWALYVTLGPMSEKESAVLKQLSLIVEPELKKHIVELNLIENVKIEGGQVSFDLLIQRSPKESETLLQLAKATVLELDWVDSVEVQTVKKEPKGLSAGNGLEKVKHILMVSSCKGGVGKSTIALNLAFSLTKLGLKTGLFDADLYGPSLPTLLYMADPAPYVVGESIFPLQKYGLKVMSFGYIQHANDQVGPAILRGSMATQIVLQLLTCTQWEDLDVLVLDMPPGTGDIVLTVAQNVSVDGSVIVTTPQEMSFVDVAKGIEMFDTLSIPTLSIVENMAYFKDPNTTQKHFVFGKGAGKKLREQYGFDLSLEVPLIESLSEACDQGVPFVVQHEDHEFSEALFVFAKRVYDKLNTQEYIGMSEENIELKESTLLLKTADASYEVDFYSLRLACTCAHCVNEISGEQILNVESVSKDIKVQRFKRVGNYALGFAFSDDHHVLLPYAKIFELAKGVNKN